MRQIWNDFNLGNRKPWFKLRKALISRDFFMRLRRPAVSIPWTENIFSTKAWDAGATSKFSVIGTSFSYVDRFIFQKSSALSIYVVSKQLTSDMYLHNCVATVFGLSGSVATAAASLLIIFVERNLKRFKSGAKFSDDRFIGQAVDGVSPDICSGSCSEHPCV